jgi:hypothetical protein
MKGETTAEEILRIKSEFYSALTIYRFSGWKDYGDMTLMSFAYVQFGIYSLAGWLAILARNMEKIKFKITNTKIFDNISTVMSLENMETSVYGQTTRFSVAATNMHSMDNTELFAKCEWGE